MIRSLSFRPQSAAHLARFLALAIALITVPAPFAWSGIAFQPLGFVPGKSYSTATAISADGTVVVGFNSTSLIGGSAEAFRWTVQDGMVALGDLPGGTTFSRAGAVSADGSMVYGTSGSSAGNQMFRWTQAAGMVGVGVLPSGGGTVTDASDDGSVVVGYNGSLGSRPFRWTQATGFVNLTNPAGNVFTGQAWGVSADGSVVAGVNSNTDSIAFRWTAETGAVLLGDLPGQNVSSGAFDISADGSTIVGHGTTEEPGEEAFRWTAATGLVGLGDMPGGAHYSIATAANADGSVIVGYGNSAAVGMEASLWTEETGMVAIREILLDAGLGSAIDGWLLDIAWDVSANGKTIVGSGYNPDGDYESWVVTIPEPATYIQALTAALLLLIASCRRRFRA
jgi:probable HAF family extracellular repeat protein